MQIVYANEPFPTKVTKSIFPMGPTLRSDGFMTVAYENWRDTALEILKSRGYDGTIFLPENKNGELARDYYDQIEWEDKGLNLADAILCWLPRNLATMPGFTTNTEFGEWFKSGKLFFGAPHDAPKTRYQIQKCKSVGVPVLTSLEELIDCTLDYLGDGVFREGGECEVPLHIWHTSLFQDWYSDLTSTGGYLKGAKVLSTFLADHEDKSALSWSMRVDYISNSDDEHELNSYILNRIY